MLRAAAAGMSINVAGARIAGARAAVSQDANPGDRKFTLALVGSAIGVQGTIRQQMDWAVRYGYESIEPIRGDLVGMSSDEIADLAAEMDERGLQWAATYVPVNIREQSEEVFAAQLAALPVATNAWQAAGVTRVKTGLIPLSEDLNYLQNFRLHTDRIRRVSRVLGGYGLRLGLEYIGTKTLWTASRHAFIHTMAEALELIEAVGQENVGLVLDSWHWYCAGESQQDVLGLRNEDVISCDLNDAPAGIHVDEQIDNVRKLPATTGVIDVKALLQALVQIGYDGPIMAEPFDAALSAMQDEEALQRTASAMQRAFRLLG